MGWHGFPTSLFAREGTMNMKTGPWKAASGVALLVFAAFSGAAAAQEDKRKGVAVRDLKIGIDVHQPGRNNWKRKTAAVSLLCRWGPPP
jgi:hypothetical protein